MASFFFGLQFRLVLGFTVVLALALAAVSFSVGPTFVGSNQQCGDYNRANLPATYVGSTLTGSFIGDPVNCSSTVSTLSATHDTACTTLTLTGTDNGCSGCGSDNFCSGCPGTQVCTHTHSFTRR